MLMSDQISYHILHRFAKLFGGVKSGISGSLPRTLLNLGVAGLINLGGIRTLKNAISTIVNIGCFKYLW